MEANLTGAKLLGVERSTLVGGRFGHYVALADRDRFHFYCSQVGRPGGALETELRMIPLDGAEFYARLEGARPRNAAGTGDRCMVAVSDISGNKRAEDASNVNVLTSDRLTDIGGGPTFYSCLVEVERCGD